MKAYRKKIFYWDLIPGNRIEGITINEKEATIAIFFETFWCEFESIDPHLYPYFYYIGDNLADPEEVDHAPFIGKTVVKVEVPFLAENFMTEVAVATLYFDDGTGVHIGSERRSVPIRFT